ncbi:MAG: hypothetical protein Q9214_000156 [Letrouitia sp. 1 TL-2023]
MTELVLYDLPSKGHCRAWSVNTWKTRLVLNFKGIDYQTKWLEYPDVAPTISSLGLLSNPEATPYTVPTVHLPNGEYVMDSRKIVEKLEQLHPSPSLHLDSPSLSKIEELWPKAIIPLRGCLMPKIPRALLNEASLDYFYRTREQRFGMPLDQLEKEHGGDSAWEEARPAIEEVGKLLKAEGGPFILGNTVSYADFMLVSALHMFKRVDPASLYDRVVSIEPAFGVLYNASTAWLERDDH